MISPSLKVGAKSALFQPLSDVPQNLSPAVKSQCAINQRPSGYSGKRPDANCVIVTAKALCITALKVKALAQKLLGMISVKPSALGRLRACASGQKERDNQKFFHAHYFGAIFDLKQARAPT